MSCRMGFQFSYGSTFGHECGILAASTERLTMRATPDFDFALGETADMIRETTARFADEKIAPLADSADREDWFPRDELWTDRKSTRLNSKSLMRISYAVFCLKKNTTQTSTSQNQHNT